MSDIEEKFEDKSSPKRPSLYDVFPESKIKAQIRQHDGVGRLSSATVKHLGACSASFIKNLVKDSQEISDSPRTTLETIQSCVENNKKYEFLEEQIGGLSEKSAPKIDLNKRKRSCQSKTSQNSKLKKGPSIPRGVASADATGLSSAPLDEAIAEAKSAAFPGARIVVDEDDYD